MKLDQYGKIITIRYFTTNAQQSVTLRFEHLEKAMIELKHQHSFDVFDFNCKQNGKLVWSGNNTWAAQVRAILAQYSTRILPSA